MKLLVGRVVLACCFLAVLVRADDLVVEVTEKVAENVTAISDVAANATAKVVAKPLQPESKTRIFGKPSESHKEDLEHEIIVIPDDSSGRRPSFTHNDDDHYVHHHHSPSHHNPPAHHHPPTHHHPPPHHHHPDPHYPTPPPHHHHPPPYPPYYPPYYPPSYHYGPQVYAPMPPPYPYYPPPMAPMYMPAPMKPITVIESTESNDSGSSHNYVKPTELLHQGTGYLWNLIDQKNNELWNLFGNKHGSGSGDKGDVEHDDGIHEIVVINTKPGTGPNTITTTHTVPSGWHNKGKTLPISDCKDD